jgi:hypothetical protein
MEPKVDKFIELQHQIRQNQYDFHDVLKDLDNWEDDIKQKDETLKKTKTVEDLVSVYFHSLFLLRFRKW